MRQQTILNIGTTFSLARDHWQPLCSRIQDIISGQKNLFELNQEIERLAQDYAARIIQTQTEKEQEKKTDFYEIDVNSLESMRPRSISCEHVALEAFQLLGLDQKLKELKFTGPQIAAATGTIIGRMCQPCSELSTHYWLQNKSGLGELIGHDFDKTSLYRMYQISDQLLKHKKTLEEYLFTKE